MGSNIHRGSREEQSQGGVVGGAVLEKMRKGPWVSNAPMSTPRQVLLGQLLPTRGLVTNTARGKAGEDRASD